MKTKFFIFFIVFSISLLLTCAGQPESSSYGYENISILNGLPHTEIELHKIGLEQQAELTGQWKAKNPGTNYYSRLQFDTNGYFQEEIFSELTGEKRYTLQGRYQSTGDHLTIVLTNGDHHRFNYSLSSVSVLKLYPVN